MTEGLLGVLERWLNRRQPELEALGLTVAITWGPSDRNPASAWLDLSSTEKSARLIVWSDGHAELTVGDYVKGEVLVDEHREISSEVGLDDAEATALAWMVERTEPTR